MLETERLYLRKLTTDDAQTLLQVFGDSEVMRFSDEGTAQDLDWTRAWIERTLQGMQRTGHEVFVIIEKNKSEPIGYCGLVDLIIDGQPETEIGYRLAKDAWGNGYATEAARAVLDHAHNRLNITRIVAMIDPGNKASKRVAEKLDMHQEKEIMMLGYTHPDLLYVSLR